MNSNISRIFFGLNIQHINVNIWNRKLYLCCFFFFLLENCLFFFFCLIWVHNILISGNWYIEWQYASWSHQDWVSRRWACCNTWDQEGEYCIFFSWCVFFKIFAELIKRVNIYVLVSLSFIRWAFVMPFHFSFAINLVIKKV